MPQLRIAELGYNGLTSLSNAKTSAVLGRIEVLNFDSNQLGDWQDIGRALEPCASFVPMYRVIHRLMHSAVYTSSYFHLMELKTSLPWTPVLHLCAVFESSRFPVTSSIIQALLTDYMNGVLNSNRFDSPIIH